MCTGLWNTEHYQSAHNNNYEQYWAAEEAFREL